MPVITTSSNILAIFNNCRALFKKVMSSHRILDKISCTVAALLSFGDARKARIRFPG